MPGVREGMLEKTFASRIHKGIVFRGDMHGVCFEERGVRMNRAQRRKLLRGGVCGGTPDPCTPQPWKDGKPDFSGVPLATVCESIWLLVMELRSRGYPVYDFDHKDKSVQGIKIIKDRVYFLAAEEAGADGKS